MIDEQKTKERRIQEQNRRLETTQTINPLTGKPYLQERNLRTRRLEDPIQAHLRVMEAENPSENLHKQGLLKELADRLYLFDRAIHYHRGDSGIYKEYATDKSFYKYNLVDILDYCKNNNDIIIEKKILKNTLGKYQIFRD